MEYRTYEDSTRKYIHFYLSGCKFNKKVEASGLQTNHVELDGSVFLNDADFSKNNSSQFSMYQATFHKDFTFDNSYIGSGYFVMNRAHFYQNASFKNVIFDCYETIMGGNNELKTTFEKEANFENTEIKFLSCFDEVIFNGPAIFKGANFKNPCFTGAVFNSTVDFTNFRSDGELLLNNCTFNKKVDFSNIQLYGLILDDITTKYVLDLTEINKNEGPLRIHFNNLGPEELKFDYQYFRLRNLESADDKEIIDLYNKTIAIQKFYGFEKGLQKAEQELDDYLNIMHYLSKGKEFRFTNDKLAHENFKAAIDLFQKQSSRYGGDFNMTWRRSEFLLYTEVLFYDAQALKNLEKYDEALAVLEKAYLMDTENPSIDLFYGAELIRKGVEVINYAAFIDADFAFDELVRLRNNTYLDHEGIEITRDGLFNFMVATEVEEMTITLSDESNIVMCKIPYGEVQMGSDYDEEDESPRHRVVVDSFYIGKYEITQEQWIAIMGDNPSTYIQKNGPVESVSFYDCQVFLAKLNEKTGLNFRLPTEAEWEYAATGLGRDRYAGSSNLNEVANYLSVDGITLEVGQFKPNFFGLYDMTGNVYEWCSDWYDEYYYRNSPSYNPLGPKRGTLGVLRGGCGVDMEEDMRITRRYSSPRTGHYEVFGLRVVLDCED